MAILKVKIKGIEKYKGIAIGRKKKLELLKEKMLKDKQKCYQLKIEDIKVE